MKKLAILLLLTGCSFEESNDFPLYPNCDCNRVIKVRRFVHEQTQLHAYTIITKQNDCSNIIVTDTIDQDVNPKINSCY
jgi:hypothetical protein